jgi:hypothetical protein
MLLGIIINIQNSVNWAGHSCTLWQSQHEPIVNSKLAWTTYWDTSQKIFYMVNICNLFAIYYVALMVINQFSESKFSHKDL